MTNKRIAQTKEQQNSDKPEASGILQRAAVPSVSDAGVQSTDDNEALALSNSVFSKDLSRVPMSTTKPQQIMAKLMVSPVVQQKNTPVSVQLREGQATQRLEMSGELSEGISASEEHKENKTGLPDNLKVGIETLSGMAMDDVKVHYNSSKPAQLKALAYTQGTDIHVGPGQETYLPHEAWHVVQQKQGKVKPTLQLKNTAINDEANLEKEADVKGSLALSNIASRNDLIQTKTTNHLFSKMKAGKAVVQRQRHIFVGTMLHHAPQNLNDTDIDETNKEYYKQDDVLASRRGQLLQGSTTNTTHDWDVTRLKNKISEMREALKLSPSEFPVYINANWMSSPGYESTPKSYVDQREEIHAFGTAWSFEYKKPQDNDLYAEDCALEWDNAIDWSTSRAKRQRVNTGANRTNINRLGEHKARNLQRTHAVEKVKSSRNDAIPHRGLRNFFFKSNLISSLSHDYVHIVTLDEDAMMQDPGIKDEIIEHAKKNLINTGTAVTATDYVYERDDLFMWFASYLDKVGRYVLESKHDLDTYPAEPGLTFSYAQGSQKEAIDFLTNDPFGAEEKGDARDGDFKSYVNSTQSVEGKNLRQKWRYKFHSGRPQKINRTLGYISVKESDAQRTDSKRTVQEMWKNVKMKEEVKKDLVATLINSDSYHSLNTGRTLEPKKTKQIEIIQEATNILNRGIMLFPEDVDKVKEKVHEQLQQYMKNSGKK